VVVGSRNWITPAPECEEYFFPQTGWLIDAIHEKIVPLKGHEPSTVQTNLETLRKNRLGV
jgi:2-oxoisovalerate dehydrogenase E1 component